MRQVTPRGYWGPRTCERNIYIGWLRVVRGYSRNKIAKVFDLSPVRISQIIWRYRWFMRHGNTASLRLLPLCVKPCVFMHNGDMEGCKCHTSSTAQLIQHGLIKI